MVPLSESFTNYLVNNEIVCERDKDLYAFGLEQGMFFILNLVTTLFIGLCFGMIWQGLIFSLAYLSLRSYSGGYHTSSLVKCYFLSVAIVILFYFLLIVCSSWSQNAVLILGEIASSIALMLSPVESKNKPLNSLETKVYKKRAIVIILAENIIIILFYALQQTSISIIVSLAITFVSGMLLFEKITNISLEKK